MVIERKRKTEYKKKKGQHERMKEQYKKKGRIV